MDKYAFFVEGFTEVLFVENVLKVLVGQKNLSYKIQSQRGGSTCPFRTIVVRDVPSLNAKYFFLICDCGGETNVKSYLLEQRQSLINAGYKKLYGIRDVYPNFDRTEIHELDYKLLYRIPQNPIPTKFILPIMEIESWMIAEWTFFQKFNSSITLSSINAICGMDVSSGNTENIDEPANRLNDVLATVGGSYTKGCTAIAELIDYDEVCLDVRTRVPSLEKLCTEIEMCLV